MKHEISWKFIRVWQLFIYHFKLYLNKPKIEISRIFINYRSFTLYSLDSSINSFDHHSKSKGENRELELPVCSEEETTGFPPGGWRGKIFFSLLDFCYLANVRNGKPTTVPTTYASWFLTLLRIISWKKSSTLGSLFKHIQTQTYINHTTNSFCSIVLENVFIDIQNKNSFNTW